MDLLLCLQSARYDSREILLEMFRRAGAVFRSTAPSPPGLREKQNSDGLFLLSSYGDVPCSGSGEMSILPVSPAARLAPALIAALPARVPDVHAKWGTTRAGHARVAFREVES